MNLFSEAEVEEDEYECDERDDFTFFCALRMKKVLVVSETCFCRVHNFACAQCRYDSNAKDRVLARVIVALADALNKQRSQK